MFKKGEITILAMIISRLNFYISVHESNGNLIYLALLYFVNCPTILHKMSLKSFRQVNNFVDTRFTIFLLYVYIKDNDDDIIYFIILPSNTNRLQYITVFNLTVAPL